MSTKQISHCQGVFIIHLFYSGCVLNIDGSIGTRGGRHTKLLDEALQPTREATALTRPGCCVDNYLPSVQHEIRPWQLIM